MNVADRQPAFLKDKGDAFAAQGNYRWGHVKCIGMQVQSCVRQRAVQCTHEAGRV